jgi:hypothetical protein
LRSFPCQTNDALTIYKLCCSHLIDSRHRPVIGVAPTFDEALDKLATIARLVLEIAAT